jgi:radical SAM superfamily enzyme YgiQ (UPF0313 family)
MVIKMADRKTFKVILIKPSQYDTDGYVVQWFRSITPSNALACVCGIVQDAALRHALGDDIEIVVTAYDEYNTRIPIKAIKRDLKNPSDGVVMLVGVHTHQYPRAMDLARPLREAGVQVMMGGFHVSGCLAMVPDWEPALALAKELGVSLFAGELEDHVDAVLKDAQEGCLKPLYNVMDQLPTLDVAPTPWLPKEALKKAWNWTSIDLGRGCPFLCSFCTIINVQGRLSRSRSVESVVEYFRVQAKRGVTRYLFTDDNFARNKNWEVLLDGIIKLREEEGIIIDYFMQVDTKATRIPRFVEKAKLSGCSIVFLGIESVRQESVKAAGKTQNKVAELRDMVMTWKRAGILTQGAFIIGFPTDTPESIAEDLEFIKTNIPIDVYESTMLMPLPGSADHRQLLGDGVAMDLDFNRYDGTMTAMEHPNMSREQWAALYWKMYHVFYSWSHIETIFKRALACGLSPSRVFGSVFGYYGPIKIENLHPLVCGTMRRKFRHARRYGLPLESPWIFYPKRLLEVVRTQVRRMVFISKLAVVMVWAWQKVLKNGYTDTAIEQRENDQVTPEMSTKLSQVALG